MNPLSDPAPNEVEILLDEEFKASAMRPVIVLVGKCTVEYSGRAKSFLGLGERVVVVKPDGVVLVHRVGGRDPVNWQPPGTTISWWCETDNKKEEEELVLEAVHHKQQERMVLRFKQISIVFVKTLADGGTFSLVGLEKDLVDSIEEDPSIIEEGLVIVKREQVTKSGSMDLVCRDKDGVGVIVEVKKGSASSSAANQLIAYANDVREKNPDAPLRAILVAPKIQPAARTLLEMSGLEYREIVSPRKELPHNQSTMDKFF